MNFPVQIVNDFPELSHYAYNLYDFFLVLPLGDIRDGFVAIFRCVNNKAEFFAHQLHKSMKGLGTNDRQLIRIVVTRCEIDMVEIKGAFERIFNESLKSFIKGDTSGSYKYALYSLIGEQRSS